MEGPAEAWPRYWEGIGTDVDRAKAFELAMVAQTLVQHSWASAPWQLAEC